MKGEMSSLFIVGDAGGAGGIHWIFLSTLRPTCMPELVYGPQGVREGSVFSLPVSQRQCNGHDWNADVL